MSLKALTIIVDATKCRPFGVLMLDQGVWAEVKVGNENVRLFSEHNAIGVQASVYNVNAKNWIAPSEPVNDIEDGKPVLEAMRGHIYKMPAIRICCRWRGRNPAQYSLPNGPVGLVWC
jgi:hypothetical protein